MNTTLSLRFDQARTLRQSDPTDARCRSRNRRRTSLKYWMCGVESAFGEGVKFVTLEQDLRPSLR